MSVNMDTVEMGDDEVDYSDFVYQQLTQNLTQTTANENGTARTDFEPLYDQGGLQPNQVAELVAFRLTASLSGEDDVQASEIRGSFGVEVEPQTDVTRREQDSDDGPGAETTIVRGNITGTAQGLQQTEPNVFALYNVRSPNTEVIEQYYRDERITNRGPVLDPDDELTLFTAFPSNDSANADAEIYVELIWDIYEVDDARSAFALPHGD